jgi:hypothetical protein
VPAEIGDRPFEWALMRGILLLVGRDESAGQWSMREVVDYFDL